ncbi:MAG: hypothetical protein ACLQI7_19330 [Streptosporangiaceae bacterium]
MYRLGLRLTLHSGRETFVRLLVTAAAVAVGVAIMLAVLADFHAFQITNNRPSWESTQGQPVSRDYASASSSELWNYSNDIYQGQTIERLDVAGLGPRAPVPPGISRLPASGQYYASPALAALIRSVPADELGDRYPGRLASTIGQQALTGPDTGNTGPGDTQAGATALQQRMALEGLPPGAAAPLLRGLRTFRGATVIPIYSLPQAGNPVSSGAGGPGSSGPGGFSNAVISCAGLRELVVLGQCAPGRSAVEVPAGNLFDDNPVYSTQPIASVSSPAASGNVSRLYLQAVLVKVSSAATLERVRTYLVTHATQSASGTAPRTFGEAVQAREGVAATVQRLV